MIFEQHFDPASSTYTYLLAARPGTEAILIDPVLEQVDTYLDRIRAHDLKLVRAIDTHVHADHVTGLGRLRDLTQCVTVMGAQSRAACVSETVKDGDSIDVDGLQLRALYTPGHTDDSYCFLMGDRVFTGDTLLINGTGRTDFQNGDPRAQYDSLFNVLLKLPEDTIVYPGHDYRGNTESTIGQEKRQNPRLQVPSAEAYVELMGNLNLPNPKLMDVAVPANLACGNTGSNAPECAEAADYFRASARAVDTDRYRIIDVREPHEYAGELGHIRGSELVPLATVGEAAASWDRSQPLLIVCRSGNRSGKAAHRLRTMGFRDVTNMEGGMLAWNMVGRPVEV
jgi:glyoxylase-like metal-dependent hydrolase (beta-lactamase superfamily II)/rhodanese-related sulfurtransferase